MKKESNVYQKNVYLSVLAYHSGIDKYKNVFLGVYSAAFDRQMEWVVIKGISYYADSEEPDTEKWRRFSSVMAASVVNHILKEPDALRGWPHYEGTKTAQTYSGKINITYSKNLCGMIPCYVCNTNLKELGSNSEELKCWYNIDFT